MRHLDKGVDLDNFNLEEELAKYRGKVSPKGWDIVLRLYVEPNAESENKFKISDEAHQRRQYGGLVGLVVAMSPSAYLDERYKTTGPWCEIGKWHMFAKYTGLKTFVNGGTLVTVKEDEIGPEVADPRDIHPVYE